ncbi:MAG: deoxyribose-phosphate aldolase [Candidatus Omnitrophica bacterium]|nr:deoxyribose-phosphate aldolase [Candidatus Omnitrophota bacterium]
MFQSRELARLIDHSLLHPALTDAEMLAGCAVAHQYGCATVCVKPYAVPLVKKTLKASPVGICSVVGFPHGNSITMLKLRETQEALLAGATEIDMVINIGKAAAGVYDYVKEEVRAIHKACQRHNAPLKVIFENAYLKDEQIVELCKVMSDLNVEYVKTSTGFAYLKQDDGSYACHGATEHDVKLMRRHCAPHIKIKAAGGIRTLADVLKFRGLGCARIGTSSTEQIMADAAAPDQC